MQPSLTVKLSICLLFFICCTDTRANWSGETYGGRYYDSKRLGGYLLYSRANPLGPTVIAEVLYELYTDYEFTGIGGHFLWPVEPSIDVGFVLSQAWESYQLSQSDTIDYQSNIAGLELEFTNDRLTFAAQSGKYISAYDDTSTIYFSADLYFWSQAHNWYLRGATRWMAAGGSNILFEGYRTAYLKGLPVTAYLGVSAKNSDIAPEVNVDSVYVGSYVELFSRQTTALFLWTEVAELNDELLFTVEFSLLFGSGARTPHITAFGFSLSD